ncbi:hypothetical protein [Corynebacterium parakroppenstedtii]|nr:hypothetical protein [Corynebacterium parakroppenstedtii]
MGALGILIGLIPVTAVLSPRELGGLEQSRYDDGQQSKNDKPVNVFVD